MYVHPIIIFFLVLNGPGIDAEHCILESIEGHVTVHPLSTLCFVNGEVIKETKRLKQGMMSLYCQKFQISRQKILSGIFITFFY